MITYMKTTKLPGHSYQQLCRAKTSIIITANSVHGYHWRQHLLPILYTDYNCYRQRTRITFATACQSEWHQRPDFTEHFCGMQCVNFSSIRVWPQNLEYFTTSHTYLLLFGAAEVAMNSLDDSGCTLQGQIIQMHGSDLTASQWEGSWIWSLKYQLQTKLKFCRILRNSEYMSVTAYVVYHMQKSSAQAAIINHFTIVAI